MSLSYFIIALQGLLSLIAISNPVQSYAIGRVKYGTIERFPYQAILIGKQRWGKRLLCGGTLLNNRWILTAGHCSLGVTYFDIYLGTGSIDGDNETGRVVMRSNKYIVHENFNALTAANDIALIKLPRAVSYSTRIQPALLPYQNRTSNPHFIGSRVIATGWGSVGETTNTDPMQFTELRVISNTECAEDYEVVNEGTICAKGMKNETVCSGDSGGPLVLKGTQIVVGVTSFGPADGCRTNIAGGFSRVSHYLNWIERKMGVR